MTDPKHLSTEINDDVDELQTQATGTDADPQSPPTQAVPKNAGDDAHEDASAADEDDDSAEDAAADSDSEDDEDADSDADSEDEAPPQRAE